MMTSALPLASIFALVERLPTVHQLAVEADQWPDLRIGLELDGIGYLAVEFNRHDAEGRAVCVIAERAPVTWRGPTLLTADLTGPQAIRFLCAAAQGRGEQAGWELSERWAASAHRRAAR